MPGARNERGESYVEFQFAWRIVRIEKKERGCGWRYSLPSETLTPGQIRPTLFLGLVNSVQAWRCPQY